MLAENSRARDEKRQEQGAEFIAVLISQLQHARLLFVQTQTHMQNWIHFPDGFFKNDLLI